MSNGTAGGSDGRAGDGTAEPGKGAVQSVDRALRILEILADRGTRGVTEIAVELGVHKSTASRLIFALEAHQLVERRCTPPRAARSCWPR
jgi:predicted ArsR family transcriptional regulator